MKNIKTLFRHLSAILGLFLVVPTFYQVNTTKEIIGASAWSGAQTSLEGTYYNTVANESGTALKSKLTSIISKNTKESYDWSRYEAADEAESDSSKVLLIYSRRTVAKSAHVNGSVGWNREHSFAKSLFGNAAPAVNDNHHIFADDNKTNSSRGNKPFGIVPKTTANQVKDGYGNLTDNYTTSTYFMPNDLAKGEVARSTMYMNTRYGYSITLNFASIELMLEWHLANPVTDREIYRNNTVHNLQGNRNPFIDHPEYACRIYGETNAATRNVCAAGTAEPESINITSINPTVNMGSTLALSANVLPSNAPQGLTWMSLNPSIATIDSSTGIVSPVSVGIATIKATSTNKTSVNATIQVAVTNHAISVTGVSLNKSSLTLDVGESSTLTPTITPSNATNKSVIWSSSDASIASINNGVVSALKEGTVTITVTTVDGAKSSSLTVIVKSSTEPESSLDYTFSSSGNANWSGSNFATYFGSGYGTSSKSGGTLRSTKLAKAMPVGTEFTLTLKAATNHTSLGVPVKVYALDDNNERIPNIVSPTINVSYVNTSNATVISAKAIDHPTTLTLPISMDKKVYAFEIEFEAGEAKTYIAEISLAYTLGDEATQALAFANFVNLDLGQNAYGSCETILNNLEIEFNKISSDAQALFYEEDGLAFMNAQARLEYLESWVNGHASSPYRIPSSLTDTSSKIGIIVMISILSLSAITFLYIKKKNKR